MKNGQKIFEKKEEILAFLDDLETGRQRVIEVEKNFALNLENKRRILDVFRVLEAENFCTEVFTYCDKIPILRHFSGFRVVPGAVIRRGAFIDSGAVIMPSFVNIGAQIGKKTMIDSGVTVGSCAYIGQNCHISSNTVIAGVLEPISEMPVVIEDGVFIGAQSLVAEGVRIGRGSVLASGVKITSSTKVIDRENGQEYDHIPEFSVVVPGVYESGVALINCCWIVKKVDLQSREKTSINEILRGI